MIGLDDFLCLTHLVDPARDVTVNSRGTHHPMEEHPHHLGCTTPRLPCLDLSPVFLLRERERSDTWPPATLLSLSWHQGAELGVSVLLQPDSRLARSISSLLKLGTFLKLPTPSLLHANTIFLGYHNCLSLSH